MFVNTEYTLMLSPRVMLPNLVILGATRCGTSMLHNSLGLHPNIFMSEIKELQFFNRDSEYVKGTQHYSKHFEMAVDAKVRGESTPLYLEDGVYDSSGVYHSTGRCLERINELLPDSKFIVSLRNPVKRAVSIFWKNYYQGKYGLTSFDKYFSRQNTIRTAEHGFAHILERSDYASMISRLFKCISRERCHVTIFEEWTQDIELEMHRIFAFLDVESSFQHDDWNKKQNTGANYREKVSLPYLIAATWQEKRFKRVQDKFERTLFENLRPSINELEELLERDLSVWSPKT
jgi:hypothetical protein